MARAALCRHSNRSLPPSVAANQPEQVVAVTRPFATVTVHYDPSIRADLLEVEPAKATGDQTLVDARPQAQWDETAKTAAVRAYRHPPGAVWLDQSEALAADGTHLKPLAELAALFAKVGDRRATTYCNTGHLAATDWFLLSEVLHRPGTGLYDASMSQWTTNPGRPVVK